ncbi:MAG: cytochrome c3 family protein [Pseudomonadota bacterium]
MNCHITIAVDKAPIQALTSIHESGTGIEWMRVYRLLDGVNWSHQPHLSAGVTCETCHGNVASLDVMQVATPVTAMATCLNCHRSTSASSQCETCHSWPAADDFRRFAD